MYALDYSMVKSKSVSDRIELRLESCVRDGNTAIVTYYLKNNTGETYKMYKVGSTSAYGNEDCVTQIIDDQGNAYTDPNNFSNNKHTLMLNGTDSRDNSSSRNIIPSVNLPDNIWVKGVVYIHNLKANARSFQIMKIGFSPYGGDLALPACFVFYNLPIYTQQTNIAAVERQPLAKEKEEVRPKTGNSDTETRYDELVSTYGAGKYKTKTNTELNVRSRAGQSSNIIGSLKNGVYVDVEAFVGIWAVIQYEGRRGYIHKDYIQKVEDVTVNASSNNPGKDYDWVKTFLVVNIILFLILFICLICGWDDNLFNIILFFVVPILFLIYFLAVDDPMWFMSISEVGWMVIVNGAGMVILAFYLWGTLKNIFIEYVMNIRGCESHILYILTILIYAISLYVLIITAIWEFMIIGIIMILGSASGGQYMGEFTDRNGNKFDIFKN
jgi:uncharacterized protein YgiM (DUF1202 family)